MPDYAETLLDAVSILLEKKVKAIRFDETVEATITDASNASKGEYTVTTGYAKFKAYSDSSVKYNNNDVVLVTIPQGNYDNQKIIVCKAVDKNNTPMHYISPFERIVNVTNNLIRENCEWSYWANGDTYKWDIDNPEINYESGQFYEISNAYYQKFTTLGIRAQFSTWLSEYDTIQGNYGLLVELTFQIPDSDASFVKTVTLDSSQFFGNVYNFDTFYTQEEVFDLSDFKDYPITNIKVYPYQRNNFISADGERLSAPSGDDFSTILENIFVKDVYLTLGISSEDFETDTAEIMTDKSLIYYKDWSGSGTRDTANSRQIHLRWIHKDEDTGVIKAVEEQDFPKDYEVRWYRHKIGESSPDQFAGAHWQRFYGIGIAANGDDGEWVLPAAQANITENTITIDFQPNVNLQEESIKAIVIKKENNNVSRLIATSNVLTFSNNAEVRNQASIIDANALSIRYEDDEKGHYFLYDEAGDIGANEDGEIRILTAVFSETENNVYQKPELDMSLCSSIKWIFPDAAANTMIVPMDIESNQPLEANIITGTKKVGFTIKKHLNNNATQNTIRLEVIYDGQPYTTQIQPIFGTAGTNGSDYTLILTWLDGKNALNLSKNNGTLIDGELKGEVALYDQAGNTVSIPAESELTADWLVAEFGAGTTKEKEVETEDYYYPVFKNYSNILVYNLANNPNAEDQGTGFYYFIDSADQGGYVKYDVEQKKFIEATFSDTAQLYRKRKSGEQKYKLEYRKVNLVDALDQATGSISHAYDNTPIVVDGNDKQYYYSHNKKYFIKINDQYILDPWNTYQEVETYYEPIEEKAKKYIIDSNGIIAGGLNVTVNNSIITITAQNNTSMNSLFILRLTLTGFGDYDLITYYPIPLKNGETKSGSQFTRIIDYIEGPDRVRYASSGETDFKKNPYQITTRRFLNGSYQVQRHGYHNANELPGYWQLYFPQAPDQYEQRMQPVLQETALNENGDIKTIENTQGYIAYDIPLLNPISVYIPDAIPYGVQFIDGNNDILWTQPILVYENKYPSRTLNKWNGKDIETDNEAGTITASGFAAGRKERDNTFTGVVIGDWSRSKTDVAISKSTGIYGFNHGAMSYAFKDDGTGFIGKDGKGRIYLDGDKSQIYSSRWANVNNPEGMLLDIDDGYIKMQRSNVSYTYTWVNQNTAQTNLTNSFDQYKSQYYYYYQGNYFPVVGNLTQYDARYTYYTRQAQSSETKYITLGVNQETYPLSIGQNINVSNRKFKVKWDGSVYIQDGHFEGTITGSEVYTTYLSASLGDIGGWTISSNSLSGGQTTLSVSDGITTDNIKIKDKVNNVYTPIGEIGYLRGSTGNNDTKLLGIETSSGTDRGIALMTNGNIRLGGLGGSSNAAISVYNYVSKNMTISTVNEGTVTNTFIIGKIQQANGSYAYEGHTVIYTDIPAGDQHGIYARFA